MRTVKAKIRLRIRAVWSGPSLSAKRIIWNYTMYELRAKARMILDDLNPHILRMLEDTFALGTSTVQM